MRFLILTLVTYAATSVLAKEKDEPFHHSKSRLRTAPRPRIIGGEETQTASYPYTVSLQNGQHFCGGTLIAPDVVLTAAHCTVIDFKLVTVVIGSHTIDGESANGKEVEKIPAGKVYVHPDYNVDTNNNDFALVFLPKSATANVDYIRINSEPDVPSVSDTLTAVGWGDTSIEDGYDVSNVLLEVDVDYVENDVCDASSDGQDSYKGMIFDEMLCASRPGKDGCQGDSGGPLIIKGSSPGDDIQVGVSSWGFGCASPDFPGVYARASNGYRWIRNRVCRRSKDPPEWFNCWEKKSMANRFSFKKNGKRIKGQTEN